MKSTLRFRHFLQLRRNKWRRLIPALLLASCATMGGCATKPIVRTDFCTGWRPICASTQDVLTDGTAKQILAHDEHGVTMKCWARTACKPSTPGSTRPLH